MKPMSAALLGLCISTGTAFAQGKPTAPAPPASPANVTQTVPIMLPGSPMQRQLPSAPAIGSERMGLPATPERWRQIQLIEGEKLTRQKSHNLPKPEAFWKDYKPGAETQTPAK